METKSWARDGDEWRRFMEMILAGGIGEDAWPPAWPPNPDSNDQDERQLATLAKSTGLDEAGWDTDVR